jgi:hypothetical protein
MKTLYSFSPMQEKHLIRGMTFVLLLMLLTGLISCGTNQPAAKQSSPNIHPVNVLPKQIDSCSLVTKTQIEQVLKTQVIIAQRPTISNKNSIQDLPCSYFSSDLSTSADIGLETHKDAASARTAFEYQKHHIVIVSVFEDGNAPPGNFHVTYRTILGLGDQAVLIITPQFPMLFVQKGNAILSIIVTNSGQPDSLAEKQEQQLAQLAVRNM